MPRNFRIIQRNVRAFAAQHDTRLAECVALAFRWARQNAEHNLRFFRQPNSRVGRSQIHIGTRGLCPRKRGKRRHHHGGIHMPLDLHDGGLSAFRALELHFRMTAELPILQQVFRAAMNASCLHPSNLASSGELWGAPGIFRAGWLICPPRARLAFQAGRRWRSCVTITSSSSFRRACVPEHISRKELKQDKIKETIEHGAEAVISHGQFTLIVVIVVLLVAVGYGGWRFYIDRQTVEASIAFDSAMKAYQGRVGVAPDPALPNEPVYANEAARAQDASVKFASVADKYPKTNPGKLARYYYALTLEDLERHNQALEELKRLSSGSDKELAGMAQYQMAVIYSRTGKPDDAVKIFRALADKPTALVPRPLVLLELAGVLRTTKPQEAASVYEQIKKEFPDTAIAEAADRGLDVLSPKS